MVAFHRSMNDVWLVLYLTFLTCMIFDQTSLWTFQRLKRYVCFLIFQTPILIHMQYVFVCIRKRLSSLSSIASHMNVLRAHMFNCFVDNYSTIIEISVVSNSSHRLLLPIFSLTHCIYFIVCQITRMNSQRVNENELHDHLSAIKEVIDEYTDKCVSLERETSFLEEENTRLEERNRQLERRIRVRMDKYYAMSQLLQSIEQNFMEFKRHFVSIHKSGTSIFNWIWMYWNEWHGKKSAFLIWFYVADAGLAATGIQPFDVNKVTVQFSDNIDLTVHHDQHARSAMNIREDIGQRMPPHSNVAEREQRERFDWEMKIINIQLCQMNIYLSFTQLCWINLPSRTYIAQHYFDHFCSCSMCVCMLNDRVIYVLCCMYPLCSGIRCLHLLSSNHTLDFPYIRPTGRTSARAHATTVTTIVTLHQAESIDRWRCQLSDGKHIFYRSPFNQFHLRVNDISSECFDIIITVEPKLANVFSADHQRVSVKTINKTICKNKTVLLNEFRTKWHTWNFKRCCWPVVVAHAFPNSPATVPNVCCPLVRFHSSIIRCRCCTVTVFRSSLSLWSNHSGKKFSKPSKNYRWNWKSSMRPSRRIRISAPQMHCGTFMTGKIHQLYVTS